MENSSQEKAPYQFYGIIIVIVLLVVGIIVSAVLASQNCNKDEKFGNLIDTISTNITETTKTIGDALGINTSEFLSVDADPIATLQLYFLYFMLSIIFIIGIVVMLTPSKSPKRSSTTKIK